MAHSVASKNAANNAVRTNYAFLTAFSSFPGDTGANELTGISRAAATWPTSVGGTSTLSAQVDLTIPANLTAEWVGGFSAVTGGTFGGCVPAGGYAPIDRWVIDTSTGDVTVRNHGFAGGEILVFHGGSAPNNFTEGTKYYVLATGLTTHTFRLGATAGGAAIVPTDQGSDSTFLQRMQPFVNGASIATMSFNVNSVLSAQY